MHRFGHGQRLMGVSQNTGHSLNRTSYDFRDKNLHSCMNCRLHDVSPIPVPVMHAMRDINLWMRIPSDFLIGFFSRGSPVARAYIFTNATHDYHYMPLSVRFLERNLGFVTELPLLIPIAPVFDTGHRHLQVVFLRLFHQQLFVQKELPCLLALHRDRQKA